MAEAVQSGQEEIAKLTRRVQALEGHEAGREAALLEATERIRSVSRGLQRERRAAERIERLRDRDAGATDGRGDGERDADDDWLGPYLALRGHAARPSAARPPVEDDSDE